jgi:hypothetical protein
MVAGVLVREAPRGAVPLAAGASKVLPSKAIRVRRQLGSLEKHQHDLVPVALSLALLERPESAVATLFPMTPPMHRSHRPRTHTPASQYLPQTRT